MGFTPALNSPEATTPTVNMPSRGPSGAGPQETMKTMALQSGEVGVEVGDSLDTAEIVF